MLTSVNFFEQIWTGRVCLYQIMLFVLCLLSYGCKVLIWYSDTRILKAEWFMVVLNLSHNTNWGSCTISKHAFLFFILFIYLFFCWENHVIPRLVLLKTAYITWLESELGTNSVAHDARTMFWETHQWQDMLFSEVNLAKAFTTEDPRVSVSAMELPSKWMGCKRL